MIGLSKEWICSRRFLVSLEGTGTVRYSELTRGGLYECKGSRIISHNLAPRSSAKQDANE
jgi:hypothetical protein